MPEYLGAVVFGNAQWRRSRAQLIDGASFSARFGGRCPPGAVRAMSVSVRSIIDFVASTSS
jgi:hypothetical protein